MTGQWNTAAFLQANHVKQNVDPVGVRDEASADFPGTEISALRSHPISSTGAATLELLYAHL